ncbi:MAG: hypothetical protein ABJ275_05430 [Maricaulaceae bacterium]
MSSLTLFLTLILLLAIIFAVRAYVNYKAVKQDAQDDYAYKNSRGMIDERLSETGYRRAYMRFYSPRKYIFMTGAFATVACLTVPMLGLIRFVLIFIWESSGRPDDIQPDFLVFNLLIMISLLIFWSLVFFIFARFYYRGAPVSLRNEMIKEMN